MNDLLPGDLLLLCGYRRMGKDTFCAAMKKGDISRYTFSPEFPHFDPEKVQRIAFGDILKIRVAKILNITLEELEAKKDEQLDLDYKFEFHLASVTPGSPIPTYRDVLIDQALVIKKLDPSYFVRYAMTNFYSENCINVVTDLRFFVELDYIKEHFPGRYRIARISREGVPIPPEGTYEHELDNIPVDFNIVGYE